MLRFNKLLVEYNFADLDDSDPTEAMGNFLKQQNIEPEELTSLGSGEFGTAYLTADNRVIKVTTSDNEYRLSKELVGKSKNFEGFAEIYLAEVVDGNYIIIMEYLEQDSDDENLWYEMISMLDEEGLPIQYIDHLDWEEIDGVSQELDDFCNAISNIATDYRRLGVEASDISIDNIGRDKNGNIKAFDIDDKNR